MKSKIKILIQTILTVMVNQDIGCNMVVQFGAMRDDAMKEGWDTCSVLSNAIFALGDLMKKNVANGKTDILAEGIQSKINQNTERVKSQGTCTISTEKSMMI
mmetsp:Transcript_8424/g.10551  ORF Transcript_8424/g.10551 Transcript_8424/m.10551 type:complete len:102 (+) Transcript_8424:70-375(+)